MSILAYIYTCWISPIYINIDCETSYIVSVVISHIIYVIAFSIGGFIAWLLFVKYGKEDKNEST